jgi:hypothetical protein
MLRTSATGVVRVRPVRVLPAFAEHRVEQADGRPTHLQLHVVPRWTLAAGQLVRVAAPVGEEEVVAAFQPRHLVG